MKPVKGYEGLYSICDTGIVFSHRYNRGLNPCKAGRGYPYVVLYDEHSVAKNVYVHRLVAEHYIPNPNDLETVDHTDGDKTNNHVSNLRWLSNGDNTRHAHRRRWTLRNPQGEIVEFYNLREFCRTHQFSRTSVRETISGIRRQAYGWTATNE